MSKYITAIVLDGFHKGHVVRMEYMKKLRLLKPRSLTVDYCCDGDTIVDSPVDSYVDYEECFRAVDGDVVLFTEKGKSMDILSWFEREVTAKKWTECTTLYFGYHNEPVLRKDDGTQMTEYDRGFNRGVEEGRILQAKESRPY